MSEIEMEYGPRFGADTGTEIPWMGAGGSVVGQDVWGKYFEAVRRGYVFAASCAATGWGGAFTTTPPLSLWNPPNSGRNLSILRCAIAPSTVQSTIDAIAYGFLSSVLTTPTGGTALTEAPTLIGSNGQPVGQAFGAGTLATAPTILCGAFVLTSATPTSGSAGAALTADLIDGAIVVAPGGLLAVQGVTTGVTGTGIISLIWAEVPILPG